MNGNEIISPDLNLGKLVEEQIFVAHHEAIEAVEEQWHYEVIAEYPNGGKDVKRVIDIPAVEPKDAWDEYETVQRYVPYTEEELAEIEAIRNQPTRLDRIEAQVAYIAMMTGNSDILEA
jgi:hypothetical protein